MRLEPNDFGLLPLRFVVAGQQFDRGWEPPFGYVKAHRLPDRRAYVVSAEWVAPLLRLWHNRYRLWEVLMLTGLWDVEEGGYYRDGRFSLTGVRARQRLAWRFMRDWR